MIWIIGTLTFILVLTSILLILLILVQLPKKEAGLGTAFGGGTTDALFGAGAGNVLTKLTKWCTITFFVITMSLSVLNARQARSKETNLERNLELLNQKETQENLQAPSTVPPVDTNVLSVVTNTVNAVTNSGLLIPSPTETPAAPSADVPTPAPASTPEPAPATPPPNN